MEGQFQRYGSQVAGLTPRQAADVINRFGLEFETCSDCQKKIYVGEFRQHQADKVFCWPCWQKVCARASAVPKP